MTGATEPAVADPRLVIDSISHIYRDVKALDDINLTVEAGEFLTLLGPSGCGKSTLLRIVAGFLRPTDGRVWLHGDEVTDQPAHKRAVNLVFQRPTLFPHLDVFENVAFGLRLRKGARQTIPQRVEEALGLVRLSGYETRRASELSGGQMQRVAMARALVNRPAVLLLDEPLSALDLKIRLEMEVELRRVHRETGATIVYVTHDQREALALSDRIAILCDGRLEQCGTPEQIYATPASPFAARFVGDANVLPVGVAKVSATSAIVELPQGRIEVAADGAAAGSGWLVVRPEALRMGAADAHEGALSGAVIDVAYRGTGFSYRLDVDGFDEPLKIETAVGGGAPPEVGSTVSVVINPSQCLLLQGDRNQ